MDDASTSAQQRVSLYLLHLMGCAQNDLRPKVKPGEISWESIYKVAAVNSFHNLVWFVA